MARRASLADATMENPLEGTSADASTSADGSTSTDPKMNNPLAGYTAEEQLQLLEACFQHAAAVMLQTMFRKYKQRRRYEYFRDVVAHEKWLHYYLAACDMLGAVRYKRMLALCRLKLRVLAHVCSVPSLISIC